jgi:cysteine desulfurase
MLASNEIGTLLDIKAVINAIDAVRKDRQKRQIGTPLYLHSDATQAGLYSRLYPKRLGFDLMSINGGKIYGPKQSGMAFVRAGIVLEPVLYGGGQERSLRSGTENVASCVGFAEALLLGQTKAEAESKRLTTLREKLRKELEKLSQDFIFHGHPAKRLPNHLSFAIPGWDGERLAMELDALGIMVGIGSACSASKSDVSKVLKAIGVNNELAQATIRVTLGRGTTNTDINTFVKVLAKILANGPK